MRKGVIIGLIVVVVGLLTWLFVSEVSKPRPVDWEITYSRHDKNPYGSFLVYENLPQLFPEKQVKPIEYSIYDMVHPEEYTYSYDDDYDYEYEDEYEYEYDDYYEEEAVEEELTEDYYNAEEDTNQFNLIFIADMITINTRDSEALKEHVEKGNAAFFASHGYNVQVPDLGVFEVAKRQEAVTDSTVLNFTTSSLKRDSAYAFRKGSVATYFSVYPEKAEVLAINNFGDPILLRVPIGKGALYFCSTPLAYTNYHFLLPENHDFLSASLSYLPVENTYWAGNYLSYINMSWGDSYGGGGSGNGSGRGGGKDSGSILQFIHAHEALTWAFYLLLATAFLYLIVGAKRKQRIIPEVQPPKNSTVEFTHTVSQLYLQRGNHKDIAEKRITFFLEYVRTQYYLNTNELDDEFVQKLHEKSGVPLAEVRELVTLIHRTRKAATITQHQLIQLNHAIDSFKKRA